MPNYVKLQKVEIYGVFACPNCGAEEWLNIKKLRRSNKMECMCCEKPIYPHPVESIEIIYKDGVKPTRVRKLSDKLKDFVPTLAKLGMTKTQAKKLIQQNEHLYDNNDEEFLKLLLETTQ